MTMKKLVYMDEPKLLNPPNGNCIECGKPYDSPYRRYDGQTISEHCLATMHEVSPWCLSTVIKWRKAYKAKFGYVPNGLDGIERGKSLDRLAKA